MIVDPPPPTDLPTNLVRAADLKNRVLLIRPTAEGEWPARDDGKGPQPYIEADVWILDRQGIEDEATGVRFSWYKAVRQLRELMFEFVACRPVEQDDRSVSLEPVSGAAREVAERVARELEARFAAAVDDDPAGEEPF